MKELKKKLILGAAASLLLVIVPAIASAADAVAVSNDAFSITLPPGFAAFTSQSQKTTSADGTIETTNWVSKAPTGEAVVVTVSKMPGKILDAEKMTGSTRDSLLKALKATVESEQKVTGAVPGTQVLFKSEGATPAFLSARLLVQDNRLYQILYVGRSADQRNAPAIAQVFDSFTIKTPPADAAATTTAH